MGKILDSSEAKLLIVDDTPKTQETLKSMFATLEATITLCDAGDKALKLLKTGYRPNVILLDLNLPVVSGPQVLQAIRSDAKTKHIPVITFSSTVKEIDNQPFEKDIKIVEEYLKVKESSDQAGHGHSSKIVPKFGGQEGVDVVHPRLIVEVAQELILQGFELSYAFRVVTRISQNQLNKIGV